MTGAELQLGIVGGIIAGVILGLFLSWRNR